MKQFCQIISIKILILLVFNNVFAKNMDLDDKRVMSLDINSIPDDVEFFDQEGKKHYFDEFDGKTVLIVFWASWLDEAPDLIISLDYLKKDFRKLKFDIIAISEDYQGVEHVKKFYDKYGIRHLKIYHDFKNKLYNHMKITNLPTFLLLDADFTQLYNFHGRMNWNDESVRNTLLSFIPGNPPIPRNTFTKNLIHHSQKKMEIQKIDKNKKKLDYK